MMTSLGLDGLSVVLNPLLPVYALAALALAFGAIFALSLWRRARGKSLRLLAGIAILAALLDPSIVKERRDYQRDIAVIVLDRSPSQSIGTREADTSAARLALERQMGGLADIDVKIIEGGGGPDTAEHGTRLIEALRRGIADLPPARIAGIVIVSEGQIHDIPAQFSELGISAPVHLLLTDDPGKGDRRIELVEAPSFGLVGRPIEVKLRVEDLGLAPGARTILRIRRDGEPLDPVSVTTGEEMTLPLDLEHGGQTVFEIEVEAGAQELTLSNNRAVLTVNGVRDRLRVLLISGEPYPGERTWRNLLKSDPSVDLIHFTILRPPNKQDATPINELALIAFPIDELFDIKLREFDLIIFDRFQHLGILPEEYFLHIVDYVREGGAVLESAGPSSGSQFSLYRTPLAAIFAAMPTGEVIQQGYKPGITALGKRHPVTADLLADPDAEPNWGRWFRQMAATTRDGDVLMDGAGGLPLLILERVGKGRVAQIFSDHLWLWSKGFEGGGPQAELIRRTAHWLMQEPDLEEEDLRATAIDGRLEIERRSLDAAASSVTVIRPDGSSEEVALSDSGRGRFTGSLPAADQGLYKVSDAARDAFAALGEINSKEFEDPRASALPMQPLLAASGGGYAVFPEFGSPDLRRVGKDDDRAGNRWFGFVRNEDFVVTGIDRAPLLPPWIALILATGLLLAAWRREGR
ncbi:putative membrane protein [Dongia mobilis]|uniref:Putative membrane protein n=1 Tax=Dongia mobilis TaxID=578943 RepID=A0A4R6WWF2_9PROT|nr:hypothetical protein [Dongia mobilis]TDQ84007.1 putative membrane protein [Dongia mobilis]